MSTKTSRMRRWRIAPALRVAALCLTLLLLAAGTEAAVADTPNLGLSYDLGSPTADPGDNQLDLYTPDGASPTDSRPVVVYVHGGGWRQGDKSNKIADKIDLFTGSGYVFASINYRLSPTGGDPANPDPGRIKFPAHPDDVGEAIGWLGAHVDEYGGDPTRILLIGHSAGAHLISLVATDPSYVEAYGVEPWQLIGAVSLDTAGFDIVADGSSTNPSSSNRGLIWNAFGTPAENAVTGAWLAGSPIHWAGAEDPDFLLVTSFNPSRVADNQAMATALDQDPAGVFRAPYDHEGINAAVGGPADASGETMAIMDFLGRMIQASADPKVAFEDKPRKLIESSRGTTRVRFAFSSKSAGATFECRLDKAKFKRCRSPKRLIVDRGRHKFQVRAIADRGRPGASRSHRFRLRGG